MTLTISLQIFYATYRMQHYIMIYVYSYREYEESYDM